MDVESSKDPMRAALKMLIQHSNATFSADDVLREFRTTKEKRSNRKLLKILEIISKNQPKAEEHLLEVAKLLEKKDPFYCLLNFLNHYSESNIMQSMRKKDISTSTPLLSKKMFETVTPDSVSEIKERVVQAATGGHTRQTQNNSITNIVGGHSPTSSLFPTCNKQRNDALWDFQTVDNLQFQQSNISAIPINSQETLLLYDLIYCLTGMRGSYITSEESGQSGGLKFKISEQIHSSLRDIAQEMLPLASYYTCVEQFIQNASFSDCGQVLQALSEALRSIIHDYYLLLAQLESELNAGNLTVHKMLFYVRPTLNTMEVLAGAVSDILVNELRGGQALTLLFNKISALTGDEESQKFVIQLTQLAAVPYMEILQLWVQKGVICDPQQEFLVEDNEVIRREELPDHYSADYWEKRYTIRRERIPCFLEKVSDIILRTGKYLNVIRQCGKKVTPPQSMNLQFSPTNQNHINVIQNAYRFASKNLLEVLLKENDLMGHLMSVKRYLLLHQGDFITQFMDACEDELTKNVDKVLPMTLENLLGLTLRLSSAKHDPYKDDVHCELLTYDLVTQMSKIMNNEEEYWQLHDRLDLNGLECFAFRYEVKWPVSLVLNHIAISKYQMLFRQLFYCKHVERQLCKIWKENSIAKKFSPQAAELYRSAFTLRQRMMNAVQNLEYYMMIEVIEPNWHIFIQNMNKVENVDEVLSFHQDFLDSCLKNCMLTDTTLLNRSIFKLCNICLKFCEFIQSESSLTPNDTFSERVKRFDLEFTGLLIGLLKQINDVASDNPSDRFINLVHRINFNSFYNQQMDKLCAKDSMISHQ
ncbi:PREDICTED: gamma-tubulin complex component 2 homolog isoform X4 [Rhagoletis zephyria]|uniref:gamma-tubulin complex component 2 homolog isoform X4 n=1 Tax=Rhagoletis zephyria TaxID=28612 RepID=UPI00081198EB|nr:PREDICTED: gamma-tubulin complex component 2 homolog isoform X4 [Rhagoletis zephyria]XP_036343472.1 gamma-tubulin complex component 2 homolog isoform X2 [Rhagoletis pomonella]